MNEELQIELAWFLRDLSKKQPHGLINWDSIAESLVNSKFINKITQEQRDRIYHDFKRLSKGMKGITEAHDNLFLDVKEATDD